MHGDGHAVCHIAEITSTERKQIQNQLAGAIDLRDGSESGETVVGGCSVIIFTNTTSISAPRPLPKSDPI